MNMRLDRSVIHARDRIFIEVALLHASIRYRDITHERNRRSKYRGAFELRLDAVRIDHRSTIHCHVDPRYSYFTVRSDINFDDSRDVSEKASMSRDPDRPLIRFLISPTRPICNGFYNPPQARRIKGIFACWLSV